ncbi:MAG: BREX-2 system phosphatase PglZ, partial [Planctomycetia bacterium]|nr:BREX-2 system phosphatase PglZ [Planctomycetia bacterium]
TKSDYDEGRLTDAMRDEIGSPGRRVIAAIVNAVDDHLAKADQVDVRWSPESIPLLDGLLHEATNANRLVVITSDHGHVLETGTTARVSDGGERWRPTGGELASDELVLRGPRVLAPGGEIVTSWSERVRYIAPTKRGYHGGVNPQEMIVPIAVLGPAGKPEPEGWQFVPESAPAWWYAGGDAPIALPAPTPPAAPPPGMLFDIHRDEQSAARRAAAGDSAPPAAGEAPVPQWVAEVFATEMFAMQKDIVGRAYPGDDVIGRMLAALDSRGGKLTKAALARAISYPLFRMQGLLSNTQRVLNVDGYPVIAVDAESDTVSLDQQVLFVQFGLTGGTEGRR